MAAARAKLAKNRDALTQKYACRTVRFQVYVKNGKAALKALPDHDLLTAQQAQGIRAEIAAIRRSVTSLSA